MKKNGCPGDSKETVARPEKIVIEDLCLEFAAEQSANKKAAHSIPVLSNIGLTVRSGEFVCIVGPSGCGKSTLLYIIGGFLKATAGRVLIDGAEVRGTDPKRIFIFQENAIFPWLTVEENIAFGLLRLRPEERSRVVSHYIGMIGLTGFEKAYPRQLSGGMKQRVEIARALAADPDVLYMDEPFGALDYLTRMKMRAELVQIWHREKKTVLFVTHDIEESVQLADRVVVLSNRPAKIAGIVDVPLPRPRNLDLPEYVETVERIFDLMGLDHSGVSYGNQNAPEVKATATTSHTPSQSRKADADVIIIGGGPAGSVLGAYLSEAGIDHLIIDKAYHPRCHVGESLSYSCMKILKEVGFLPAMQAGGFPAKHGVSWTSWHDGEQINMSFQELGGEGYSYHVDRAGFDHLLLKHAVEKGTQLCSGSVIENVDFTPEGQATGVTVRIGRSKVALKSQIVVDASGRQAVIGRQLRLMKTAPSLSRIALHSWFENVDRGRRETADFTHIHLLPVGRGWVWQIPIDENVTSVGLVVDREEFLKFGGDSEKVFNSVVVMNPVLSKRLQWARRLRDLRLDGNYSYTMEDFAGKGWMMIGDSAFFIDPIFSSGVSIALHSAKFAAGEIREALGGEVTGGLSFDGYQQMLRHSSQIWQEFVSLFYEYAPIFSRVIFENESRIRMQQLCEGEIYDPSANETLNVLRQALDGIRADMAHPLNRLLNQPRTRTTTN